MKGVGTDIGTIHFVGIGGIGMSGIAEVMHNLGYAVQGSDIAEGYVVEGLRARGIRVMIGHQAENIGDAAVVARAGALVDAELAGGAVVPGAVRGGVFSAAGRGAYGYGTTTSSSAYANRRPLLDTTKRRTVTSSSNTPSVARAGKPGPSIGRLPWRWPAMAA